MSGEPVRGESVSLADILRTDEVAADVYRAWTPPGTGRSDIFGGQVAGQALRGCPPYGASRPPAELRARVLPTSGTA